MADMDKNSHVYNAIFIYIQWEVISDKMGSYFTRHVSKTKGVPFSTFLFNMTIYWKPTMTQEDQNKGLSAMCQYVTHLF